MVQCCRSDMNQTMPHGLAVYSDKTYLLPLAVWPSLAIWPYNNIPPPPARATRRRDSNHHRLNRNLQRITVAHAGQQRMWAKAPRPAAAGTGCVGDAACTHEVSAWERTDRAARAAAADRGRAPCTHKKLLLVSHTLSSPGKVSGGPPHDLQLHENPADTLHER
jgi:hypothetical protein